MRVARRQDLPGLVDLRVQYLAELARLEPRYALLPDVRERTEHALPVWIGQEDRILLLAEHAPSEGEAPVPVGYATGVAAIWPPVLRVQQVGEVQEVFVLPALRGAGLGRELLGRLSSGLRALGSKVLRAAVPVRGEGGLARFRALGYAPVQRVLEKSLEDA